MCPSLPKKDKRQTYYSTRASSNNRSAVLIKMVQWSDETLMNGGGGGGGGADLDLNQNDHGRFDVPPESAHGAFPPPTKTSQRENDQGSIYDGASTVKGGSSDRGGDNSHSNTIGGRETMQVAYLRMIVLLVLFFAAGGVSTTVFVITRKAQQDEFATKFEGVAAKVLETFVSSVCF